MIGWRWWATIVLLAGAALAFDHAAAEGSRANRWITRAAGVGAAALVLWDLATDGPAEVVAEWGPWVAVGLAAAVLGGLVTLARRRPDGP